MSDSDETVCNDSGEENTNTQNSPSILSNWHQGEDVCSTQKEDGPKTIAKNKQDTERHENSLKKDVADSVSRSEGSQEFPLITRGVKRKEFAGDPQKIDEDGRLESLVKTVEDLINDMERDGKKVVLASVNHAKAHLAKVQQFLVKCNHENQAKRKMVLSSSEDSQHLDEDNKLLIVNLAQKQRDLLGAFKKYKNLLQRLKALKALSEAPDSIAPRRQETNIRPSVTTQATTSTTNAQNTIGPTTRSNPSLMDQHFTNNNLTVLNQNLVPMNRSSTNQDFSTKAQSRMTQNFARGCSSQNSSQLSVQPNSSVRRQASSLTNKSSRNQVVIVVTTKPQNITGSTSFLNRPGGNQPSIVNSSSLPIQSQNQPLAIRTSTNQLTATTSHINTFKSTTSFNGTSEMNQALRTAQPGVSRQNQTHVVTNRPLANQVTTITTKSQNFPRFTTAANNTVTNQSNPHFLTTTSTSSFPQLQNVLIARSKPSSNMDSQSPLEPAIMVKQPLSLDALVKKGILAPGKNVLTTRSEGKVYSASLSAKGTIVLGGGEGFTSPRSWLKAILGSKRKVKNELAWKMVSYKNKSLLDHASAITLESTKQPEAPHNFTLQNQGPFHNETDRCKAKPQFINNADALKAFLNNCRVTGVSKEDILSSENLQEDFWDCTDVDWSKDDMFKTLNFWK